MQLRCPKCETVFNAKANARRIKCPGCTFREDTPADGFPPARKGGADTFTLVGEGAATGIPTAGRATMIAIVAVLVVAALAAAWYFTQDPGATPPTDTTGNGSTGLPPAPASAAECKNAPRLAAGLKVAAVMETNMGTIRTDLDPDQAPVTVANMVCLARAHFYDGLTFHRIIKDFMMQGGDPQGDGRGGPGYAIPDEFSPQLRFDKAGVLAMANSGPDTGGSQFFITFAPTPWLNDKHTVFGQATAESMAVVQRVNTEAASADGAPKVPVKLTRMTIVTNGASPPPAPTPTATSTSTAPSVPCLSQPNAPSAKGAAVEVDLITPGIWNVCADKDYSYVWVHNNGTSPLSYALDITGVGGAPLPSGWSVSFLAPSGTIPDAGAKDTAWAATLATLTIPSSQPAGNVTAELHAGGATRTFTFVIQAPRGTVAQPGQHANTQYTLRHPDGSIVSPGGQGPFCVDLAGPSGPGNAVSGYGWGVIGIAVGETVTLVVPPPFGYHYGGQFGNDTMYWTTMVTSLQSTSCR